MILDQITEATRIRVRRAKEILPLQELKEQIQENRQNINLSVRGASSFRYALKKEGMSFLCEVKKASPSKGIITEDFPYLQIAKEYEEAGAQAISVLTEPEFFLGSNRYLSAISREVSIPVLRKDFTVDEYQLYEAKAIGANAVLLICTLLTEEEIRHFLTVCDTLDLAALVETHTEEEVSMAVRAGAGIIGVNNRNLATFEVDLRTSIHLRDKVPGNIIYVAESGIRTPEDVLMLKNAGVDAVLIGEILMRSVNKAEMLAKLRGEEGGYGKHKN